MKKSKESVFVSIRANQGRAEALRDFLIAGALVVKETEPGTLLWTALQFDENTFAIFDTYPNPEAKAAHFQGKVAAALAEKAPLLIEGGWEDGVLKNVEHPKILGAKVAPKLPDRVAKAMFVRFTANKGKEEELAEFLFNGAAIIEETEPKTLYWYALQINDNTFAVIDFFADQAGIDAHLSGDVAVALSEKASELVEAGWEKGIMEKVKPFEVLTITAKQ
ncbi:MAG: hypothetical protein AAFX53_16500 [Bacteroidota bacterium]